MAPSAIHAAISRVDSLDGLFTGSDVATFISRAVCGHAMRIRDRVRHGLLTQHVFALAHGGDGDGRMPVVGRGHVDGVQVLFLFQQFAIIAVRRAAFVGRFLARP